MIGRALIACLLVAASMYVTQSKDEVDSAELSQDLARSRARAAEERAADADGRLADVERRALLAEAKLEDAAKEMEALQRRVERREPVVEVRTVSLRSGAWTTEEADAVRGQVERVAMLCARETEARGSVKLEAAVQPSGRLHAVRVVPLGERLSPVAHCLRTEADAWTIPVRNGKAFSVEIILRDP